MPGRPASIIIGSIVFDLDPHRPHQLYFLPATTLTNPRKSYGVGSQSRANEG